MSSDDDQKIVEMLIHRLGDCREFLRNQDHGQAWWRIEFAASELEAREVQLALAELLVRFLLAREPNRRRQNLMCRILVKSGRPAEAEELFRSRMPHSEAEEAQFQQMKKDFQEWMNDSK